MSGSLQGVSPRLCPPSVPCSPCSPGPVPLTHRPSGRTCGAQWSPVFLPHCGCLCPHSRQRGGLLVPCSPRPEPLSNAWWELLHPLKAALCGSALCSPALTCSAVPRITPHRHSPTPAPPHPCTAAPLQHCPALGLLSPVLCSCSISYLIRWVMEQGWGEGQESGGEAGTEGHFRLTVEVEAVPEQVCGLLGCSPCPYRAPCMAK